VRDCRFYLLRSPGRDRTAAAGFRLFDVRIQSKLVSADVEPDMIRLVEVRLDFEGGRIPRSRLLQIRDVIDDRPEAEITRGSFLRRRPPR
jgi:hypothetical protein